MKKHILSYIMKGGLFLFAALVIGSSVVFIKTFKEYEISGSLSNWSDYAVCLTAVFTFVSLGFIYVTYKKQTESNYKLQFDSTFFNLLHIQRDILDKLNKLDPKGDYFKVKMEKIKNYYPLDWSEELNSEEAMDRVERAYYMSDENNSTVMHYFRHLYHIIKLVLNSGFTYREKMEYIDIIQAQMSDNELFVMFYNVISYKNREYISWLDYFHFFENIRSTGTLFDRIKVVFFRKTNFKYSALKVDYDKIRFE